MRELEGGPMTMQSCKDSIDFNTDHCYSLLGSGSTMYVHTHGTLA